MGKTWRREVRKRFSGKGKKKVKKNLTQQELDEEVKKYIKSNKKEDIDDTR